MKVLKAKIKVEQTGNRTKYIYPKIWLDNIKKIPVILYPNDNTDDIKEVDQTYKTIFVTVPDDLYDTFLKSPEFSKHDQIEMDNFAEKHLPVKDRITDPEKVIGILAKSILGTPLTKEEQDAINPEKTELGINKTKSWEERCVKYGVTNI